MITGITGTAEAVSLWSLASQGLLRHSHCDHWHHRDCWGILIVITGITGAAEAFLLWSLASQGLLRHSHCHHWHHKRCSYRLFEQHRWSVLIAWHQRKGLFNFHRDSRWLVIIIPNGAHLLNLRRRPIWNRADWFVNFKSQMLNGLLVMKSFVWIVGSRWSRNNFDSLLNNCLKKSAN